MRYWEKLVKLEPRLKDLFKEAKAISGADEHFCANDIWYDYFKPQVSALVGNYREDPPEELQTTHAYDVAYQTIYNQLPYCRKCGCM